MKYSQKNWPKPSDKIWGMTPEHTSQRLRFRDGAQEHECKVSERILVLLQKKYKAQYGADDRGVFMLIDQYVFAVGFVFNGEQYTVRVGRNGVSFILADKNDVAEAFAYHDAQASKSIKVPKRVKPYWQPYHDVWEAYRAAQDAMQTLEQALGRLPHPAPPTVKKK